MTDSNPWAFTDQHLSATNSFRVVVGAVPAAPFIESIHVESEEAVLRWTSVAGQKYRLEYKSALEEADWAEVLPDITATGSSCSATNSLGGASTRFFRVRQITP